MPRKKSKFKPGSNLVSMAAAMIPGAKVDLKGRILVNVATSKDTVVFNIGGSRFETYRSTLHRLPNSPLSNEKFLTDHYREGSRDYFFDRDPDVFRATLNYLRTGELHLPSYLCGPAAKMELEFWGVLPSNIERCCWTNYNSWNSTLAELNQLDRDRRGSEIQDTGEHGKHAWWPKVWKFVSNPHSSVYSKCFGYFGLFLVFLSIWSFVAGTTEYFTVCSPEQTITLARNGSGSSNNTSHVVRENGKNLNQGSNVGDSVYQTVRVKHDALMLIDLMCLVYFTIEYIVRVIFSPKRLKFITSTMAVFDLLAILPDCIELIILATRPDLVEDCEIPFIACARTLRIFRLFRLMKYVPGLWILLYTFKASFGELILLVSFMTLGILLFSSLIYFVDSRETFSSIPEGFWWALITMTTVGYGDLYPTTTLGKLVGSLCAMTGLLMVGLSVPTIVNNFLMYYKHMHYSIQAERMAEIEKKQQEEKKKGLRGQNILLGPVGRLKESVALNNEPLEDSNCTDGSSTSTQQESSPLVETPSNVEE